MRIRGLLLALVIVSAACASSPAPETDTEGWTDEVVAYKKAVSATRGIVGYVKVRRYSKPECGSDFILFHVYDLEFQERGIVTPEGRATRYVYLPDEVARVKGYTIEKVELGAQPLEWQTAEILEVPTDITIVEANPGDFK